MNWNISAWSIKQPIPSILMFLILSIVGVMSYLSLGIDENPNIDMPTVTVSVTESGAAPSELETQVTRRVEDAIAGIGNIKHISSTINEGSSQTIIEFELGTNVDRAVNDVRDAITRIRSQLPLTIDEPQIKRLDFSGGPFATYTISSDKRTLNDLSWLIDDQISRVLLAVPGVGQVQRSGGVDRQVRIDLDPTKLEALGVTADTVNTQVRMMNINLPGGRGYVGVQEQSIRTIGSMKSIDDLRNMRIYLNNGNWSTLGNLGTISDGQAETRQSAMLDGKPVVAFQVVRSTGSSLATAGHGVDKAIEQLKKTLPADIHINKIRSTLVYTMDSYHATVDSLVIGALLAVVVIWAFLKDWRAAGISAVAMPLSMMPTFAVMKMLGFTLNNMSLLGLALVIGILVDDAIVEIENIVRHIRMGKSPYQAALEAADEIGLAVMATTMSIIVVFLPVAFMGGIPGQFFKQFGVTVAVAVFFSLVVARLITPMMAAFWLNTPTEEDEGGKTVGVYRSMLVWALDNRMKTVLGAVAFFIVSMALMTSLPTSLVPAADRGETLLSITLPPGAQLDTTTDISKTMTDILLKRPEVAQVFGSIGTPSSGRAGSAGAAGEVNKASLYIMLKPRGERKISQQEFEDLVRPELIKVPGVRASFSATMGLGGKVQITLVGNNEEDLKKTSEKLTMEMRTVPGLFDVSSSAALRRPEIQVTPDTAAAADQGVSVQQIARTATMATVGDNSANLAKFDLADRQIGILVQIDPRYRENIESIGNLRVMGSQGKSVPLSQVAKVEFGSGAAEISRYDRSRKVTITASLAHGGTLGEALKLVHKLPTFKTLPASVHEMASGDVEIQKDIFSGFGMAIGVAVMLIYAVLVLLFNDFLQPLTIMMSLPMAVGGAALGLLVSHQPIGLYALIGIVMLMGLVTKNAILLVEYCLVSIKEGVPRDQALVLAGEARLRPILMTTVAMVAGMVPIALGIGAGSEVRASMAAAVIGGLITSTLLTLVVVPVVFTYIDDFEHRFIKSKKPSRRALYEESTAEKVVQP
jgi:HAE1 family hydrophobic/amphiphilic exporter-1